MSSRKIVPLHSSYFLSAEPMRRVLLGLSWRFRQRTAARGPWNVDISLQVSMQHIFTCKQPQSRIRHLIVFDLNLNMVALTQWSSSLSYSRRGQEHANHLDGFNLQKMVHVYLRWSQKLFFHDKGARDEIQTHGLLQEDLNTTCLYMYRFRHCGCWQGEP